MAESDVYEHLASLQDQISGIHSVLATMTQAISRLDPEAAADLQAEVADLQSDAADAMGAIGAAQAAAGGDDESAVAQVTVEGDVHVADPIEEWAPHPELLAPVEAVQGYPVEGPVQPVI